MNKLIKKYKKILNLIFTIPLCFLSAELYSNEKIIRGDGTVRIYVYHLNQFAEVKFRKDEKIIPEGMAAIEKLLQSRDSAETTPIDPKLIDLIDHLQDHFQVDTIEVISGYRRKEFNEQLLKTGHKVSPVSFHMQGKAIDIHLDEIREETLRDYLLSLKLGGVGYYAALDFVHLDTGPVRNWTEPSNGRKLIGVLVPSSSMQLTTNKNKYAIGEEIEMKWEGQNLTLPNEIKLDHFWRGKWEEVGKFPVSPEKVWKVSPQAVLLKGERKTLPFGKYRWTFLNKDKKEINSSNEFYLKKI